MKQLARVIAVTIALAMGGGLFVTTNISSWAESTKTAAPQKVSEQTAKAMVAALNDERRSEAQYQAVLNKFGKVRPFTNIIEAERRHQAMLLELFEKYNVTVPVNELPKEVAPETLRAACEAGVASEIENIALYDELLKDIKEADIRTVFTRLRDASEFNHLPAFNRCAAGGGSGKGQGRGRGQGRGQGQGHR